MSIKATENKDKQVEIKYPCLMKSKDYDSVVLFHEECKGTVLIKNRSSYDVGTYHTCFVMHYFTPIDYSITLVNEF